MSALTYTKLLLHEVETDLWDGYYFDKTPEQASDLKRHWDEKRPAFTHVLVFDQDPFGVGGIPRDKFLPNAPFVKHLRSVN